MVSVKIPATSANIGVGYDCLGLAFDLYATFTFEKIEEGLIIKGCQQQFQNKDNLVYQAFIKTLAYMKEPLHGISITIDSQIPESRGLGSSAACIVAGAIGANKLHQNRLSLLELFEICNDMEGHPDNVAPALFGGLCLSFTEETKPYYVPFKVHDDLTFCAIIPNYEVSTDAARKILPTTLTYQDAIYQMGRLGVLCKALEINDGQLIHKACKDRMHEPYRKGLIKEYDQVKQICFDHHALTMYISGSGSTMMAICNQDSHIDTLIQTLKDTFPLWTIEPLKVVNNLTY